MDDYETDAKKQAAANVLLNYSQFVMACIGEGVRPNQLRIHLMKELSGMPTQLKKEQPSQTAPVQSHTSPENADIPSSSAGMGRDGENMQT